MRKALTAFYRKVRRRSVDVTQDELAELIDLAYLRYLGRNMDVSEFGPYATAYDSGVSIASMLRNIRISSEAALHRDRTAFMEKLSDGQFIIALAGMLFNGRGPNAEELENWKTFLGEEGAKRIELLKGAANAHLESAQTKTPSSADTSKTWIMGTNQFLSREDWRKKAAEFEKYNRPLGDSAGRPRPDFIHSGKVIVSAIASLYKGGRYVERFLENITSQSIFDQAELIIIDADSPENEFETIRRYQKRFPNIIYKRINYRISVYEAWNIGAKLSRGKYLTNTNLDDQRQIDSFKLQASILNRHDFIDVVYQNFFYSYDSSLTFDEVAALGFRSDLPMVTPHNLLAFNSPHNAPMWRRKLHDELGYFDTSYRSAGDWEFWMRCISKGKNFFKINEPHVVYFVNPDGISTNSDTLGLKESHRLTLHYCGQLISPYLQMSRTELAKAIGMEAGQDKPQTHYRAVQDRLHQLAARRVAM